MIKVVLTEVETYIEEIVQAIDFSSLNQFLYENLRVKMTFEELVRQISTEGISAIDKENITTMVFDVLFYEISVAGPLFIKMLVFSLLFSVIQRLLVTKNRYISDISFLLIYSTLMVLLMQSFFLVQNIAGDGIDNLLTFLNALIPTYAVTLAFSGNGISGAALYEISFVMIYLVELLIRSFLVPIIHVFVLILFLNHLFDEDKLSKMAQLMEKTVQIILKGAFGAVIGIGVVQSMLAPAKDRLSSNMLLSGLSAMPGMGNAIGSAGEILLSCGILIKNSVGVIALLILVLVSIVPVIKVGFFWFMYYGLSALLQPIADKRVAECVTAVARGCELYLKIILYSMLLFFVIISMVTMATSYVY